MVLAALGKLLQLVGGGPAPGGGGGEEGKARPVRPLFKVRGPLGTGPLLPLLLLPPLLLAWCGWCRLP
jgi:hypothetical protein